jgi:hypothetical protein
MLLRWACVSMCLRRACMCVFVIRKCIRHACASHAQALPCVCVCVCDVRRAGTCTLILAAEKGHTSVATLLLQQRISGQRRTT